MNRSDKHRTATHAAAAEAQPATNALPDDARQKIYHKPTLACLGDFRTITRTGGTAVFSADLVVNDYSIS